MFDFWIGSKCTIALNPFNQLQAMSCNDSCNELLYWMSCNELCSIWTWDVYIEEWVFRKWQSLTLVIGGYNQQKSILILFLSSNIYLFSIILRFFVYD